MGRAPWFPRCLLICTTFSPTNRNYLAGRRRHFPFLLVFIIHKGRILAQTQTTVQGLVSGQSCHESREPRAAPTATRGSGPHAATLSFQAPPDTASAAPASAAVCAGPGLGFLHRLEQLAPWGSGAVTEPGSAGEVWLGPGHRRSSVSFRIDFHVDVAVWPLPLVPSLFPSFEHMSLSNRLRLQACFVIALSEYEGSA